MLLDIYIFFIIRRHLYFITTAPCSASTITSDINMLTKYATTKQFNNIKYNKNNYNSTLLVIIVMTALVIIQTLKQ